jgi:hypothetical protein
MELPGWISVTRIGVLTNSLSKEPVNDRSAAWQKLRLTIQINEVYTTDVMKDAYLGSAVDCSSSISFTTGYRS